MTRKISLEQLRAALSDELADTAAELAEAIAANDEDTAAQITEDLTQWRAKAQAVPSLTTSQAGKLLLKRAATIRAEASLWLEAKATEREIAEKAQATSQNSSNTTPPQSSESEALEAPAPDPQTQHEPQTEATEATEAQDETEATEAPTTQTADETGEEARKPSESATKRGSATQKYIHL